MAGKPRISNKSMSCEMPCALRHNSMVILKTFPYPIPFQKKFYNPNLRKPMAVIKPWLCKRKISHVQRHSLLESLVWLAVWLGEKLMGLDKQTFQLVSFRAHPSTNPVLSSLT